MTSAIAAIREPNDRYRLRHVVRSELTKFLALRSTRWTLIAFPIVGVALGILIGALTGAHWPDMSAGSRRVWDPTNNVLAGLMPGYLVVPVLGVLMMSSEYGSGSIRSTLLAVPRRRTVLAAKSAVFAALTLVACEVVTFATFIAGQSVMGSAPRATFGQPGVLRALLLSGAYLALMGLFGLGLGTIIRRSGPAVAVYAGLALVIPMFLQSVPGNLWRYGPIMILANSVGAVKIPPGLPSPWVGFAVMALYTTLTMAVAAVVLVRRDA
jgi:ABC-2 type transport system permease protein